MFGVIQNKNVREADSDENARSLFLKFINLSWERTSLNYGDIKSTFVKEFSQATMESSNMMRDLNDRRGDQQNNSKDYFMDSHNDSRQLKVVVSHDSYLSNMGINHRNSQKSFGETNRSASNDDQNPNSNRQSQEKRIFQLQQAQLRLGDVDKEINELQNALSNSTLADNPSQQFLSSEAARENNYSPLTHKNVEFHNHVHQHQFQPLNQQQSQPHFRHPPSLPSSQPREVQQRYHRHQQQHQQQQLQQLQQQHDFHHNQPMSFQQFQLQQSQQRTITSQNRINGPYYAQQGALPPQSQTQAQKTTMSNQQHTQQMRYQSSQQQPITQQQQHRQQQPQQQFRQPAANVAQSLFAEQHLQSAQRVSQALSVTAQERQQHLQNRQQPDQALQQQQNHPQLQQIRSLSDREARQMEQQQQGFAQQFEPMEQPHHSRVSPQFQHQFQHQFQQQQQQNSNLVYMVQFKLRIAEYKPLPALLRTLQLTPISIGEFVIVDCYPRGEDMGVVVEILSSEEYQARRSRNMAQLSQKRQSKAMEAGNILRLALEEERRRLPDKNTDEAAALQMCQHFAYNVLKLPMDVFEAEFGFDRTSLTLYYHSEVHIDFRELVKDMFTTFKTRIWMKKMNQEPAFYPKRHATVQLLTGRLYSEVVNSPSNLNINEHNNNSSANNNSNSNFNSNSNYNSNDQRSSVLYRSV